MKRIFVLFTLAVPLSLFAQQGTVKDSDEIKLEQEAKTEAGKYEKEGWLAYPGSPSIEKQLINSWSKQYLTDTGGFPVWITSNSSGDDLLMEDAYLNAGVIATNELTDILVIQFTSKVLKEVDSNKLSREEGEHIIWGIKTSIELVLASMGGVEHLLKIYRTRGGKMEVCVVLACKLSEMKKNVPLQLADLMRNDDAQTRARHQKYLNPDYYGFE